MAHKHGALQPLNIGNFSSQQRRDRFPRTNHRNANSPDVVDLDEPPRVASWRMNLVALSQLYNLYFVASRAKIYCYIPRNLKQVLPRQPDLVINVPVSTSAIRVGGYIDENHPHSINHLKIGLLGFEEILLMCCDDGDVVAFYTRDIQQEIDRLNTMGSRPVYPCCDFRTLLHLNVGKSAWGLAIHAQSRLIAISSNNRDVTVFCPGLSNQEGIETLSQASSDQDSLNTTPGAQQCSEPLNDEEFPFPPRVDCQIQEGKMSNLLRERIMDRTFVFNLGEFANNMPSVDFVSDREGYASHIVAVDINGNGFKVPLSEGTANLNPINGLGKYRFREPRMTPEAVRSWGVLCLATCDFQHVDSLEEAWNIPDIVDRQRPILKSNFYKKTSFRHPWEENHREREHYFDVQPPFEEQIEKVINFHHEENYLKYLNLEEVDIGPSEDQGGPLDHLVPTLPPIPPRRMQPEIQTGSKQPLHFGFPLMGGKSPSQDCDHTTLDTEKRKQALARVRLVFILLRVPDPWRREIEDWASLQGVSGVFENVHVLGDPPEPDSEENWSHFYFRSYANSVELSHGFDEAYVPTRIDHSYPELVTFEQVRNIARLNMLFHIPELYLILAASQSGRVSLISLTKVKHVDFPGRWFCTMRYEEMLPFEWQKTTYQPISPLLGMAVSPVQGQHGEREVGAGRRWRVLLHYQDHTVLGYDLYRGRAKLLQVTPYTWA